MSTDSCEGSMSTATPNNQPLAAGWQRLEAALMEAFSGQPDLQERASAAVRWLVDHSLDSSARREHLARVAMCAGLQQVKL
jgi:hypothetical protein